MSGAGLADTVPSGQRVSILRESGSHPLVKGLDRFAKGVPSPLVKVLPSLGKGIPSVVNAIPISRKRRAPAFGKRVLIPRQSGLEKGFPSLGKGAPSHRKNG